MVCSIILDAVAAGSQKKKTAGGPAKHGPPAAFSVVQRKKRIRLRSFCGLFRVRV